MRPAQARQHAAQDGVEVAVHAHADTHRVGGLRVFSHRTQVEAGARLVEIPPGQRHKDVQAVREGILVEQRGTDERKVGKNGNGNARQAGSDQPDQVRAIGPQPLPQKTGHTGTKEREGQATDDLIGSQADGEKGVDRREQPSDQQGDEQRERQTAGVIGDGEGSHRPHHHHALHPQVEDPRPLGIDLANGRKDERRTGAQCDCENRGKQRNVHHSASPTAAPGTTVPTPGRARTTRSRYSANNAPPSMGNSSAPCRTKAIAAGNPIANWI